MGRTGHRGLEYLLVGVPVRCPDARARLDNCSAYGSHALADIEEQGPHSRHYIILCIYIYTCTYYMSTTSKYVYMCQAFIQGVRHK